ncbi:MAG TPA: hypothetical protein VMS55_08915 [Myxococcota bacterium]|nr:hypothetical protein [Myxococcota bacterium]
MKTNAPRLVAVIAAVALIAFGLGYLLGRPRAWTAPNDPNELTAAVRVALAKPNELDRAADLAPILASLDARNLDAVVGAYEATLTSVGPGEVAMEMLAEAWAKIDPAGAFQRMRRWEAWQSMTLPFLLRSWARRDVASARAAAETIEPGKLGDSASAAVILGWADSRDAGIWDAYVAGLPFGRTASYDLLRSIAAREGIERALTLAASVPESAPDGFQQAALRQATDIAALSDPRRAAAFVEQHRGAEPGDLERIVAKRWAEHDGPRAAEWALSQPPGPVRVAALQATFRNWFRADRQAAVAWARTQPDDVVTSFLDLYATSDPERALKIGGGIADPTERLQTQMRLARRWFAQQPETAATWLKQNDLEDLVPKDTATPSAGMPDRGASEQQSEGEKED